MAERKLNYESLKHKADGGFIIRAPSLERLYIDSALALTDQMVSLDRITDLEKKTVAVAGASREALMVAWLNALTHLFQIDKFLAKRITFQKFDGKVIQASLFGELYAPLRHGTFPNIEDITEKQIQLGELQSDELHFFAKIALTEMA